MSNSIGTGFSPSATGRSGFTTGSIVPGLKGIGVPIYVNNNQLLGLLLGGGLRGYMPQSINTNDRTDNFAKTRFTLRESWNTTSNSGSNYKHRIITPFRSINNAGDLLSRQSYSCGGNCQTFQSRPGLSGLRSHFGTVSSTCKPDVLWNNIQIDPSVPASSCNGKYVYDGSDYITFKKNQAVNRNYNDLSGGGNDSNSSQSAIRAIRRY
jgi:hypothetical protein